MNNAPITLDDLTRDELLSLLRSNYPFWSQSDLLWIKYKSASTAADKAFDELIDYREHHSLWGVMQQEQNPLKRSKLLVEIEEASLYRKRLEAKSARLQKAADALRKRWEEA